jgi:hypothetical protein
MGDSTDKRSEFEPNWKLNRNYKTSNFSRISDMFERETMILKSLKGGKSWHVRVVNSIAARKVRLTILYGLILMNFEFPIKFRMSLAEVLVRNFRVVRSVSTAFHPFFSKRLSPEHSKSTMLSLSINRIPVEVGNETISDNPEYLVVTSIFSGDLFWYLKRSTTLVSSSCLMGLRR